MNFPADFVWGAATAAHQIEGAATADGRGESIWDRFSATPGKVRNGETGALACDFYNRYPEGFYELLLRLNRDYAPPAIYITENGAAFGDVREHDGSVRDPERTSYIQMHLEAAARALAAGVPVRGYYVWSLLDNFEWSFGYAKRFGIVYVDYPTLERVPKASAHWYRDFIAAQRRQAA